MKKNKTELLVDRLKKDLSVAKKDKTLKDKWSAKSWGHEEGYLISYDDLEHIVGYIKGLRMASGRKP